MPGSTNFPASLDSHTGGNPFGFAEAINRKATTLDGALNNSATTITVVSTSGFPTRGSVAVGNEIVTYTGTSATTFTGVTRGAGGTAAISHPSGEWVASVPTAANHNDLAAAIVALQTKLGTGANVAAADTVMRGTGANATDFGKILNAHVDATAAIRMDKISGWLFANRKTSTQSIATGAAQPIDFDTADTIDDVPSGETQIHDPGTNPSRFTIGKAGNLMVWVEASFNTDFSNVPYITMTRNGAATGVSTVAPVAIASLSGWTTVVLIGAVVVAAGDYIQINAGHFAGAAVNLGDNGNQHTVIIGAMVGGT
jgi:hypothetical protein